MGTTESVFAEPSPAEKPPPHPPVDEASSQTKSAKQRQQQEQRHQPSPPPPRGTTAVRRRSFSAATTAAATATTTATTTQRCSPHSIFRLQGLVLGMEHSGKRTLLQRFEGKDPFSSSSTTPSTIVDQTEIIVPYKAPSPPPPAARQQQSNQTIASATTTTGADVWDDRIHLHVRAMMDPPTEVLANASSQDKKGISSSSSCSSSGGVDFAIVLLDPRQKQQQPHASSHSHRHEKEKHPKRQRKRLKHYLESTVRDLLHLQGYTKLQEEGESSSSSPLIRRPLCLCLLLNFRDLMGDDNYDDEHVLQESDVTSLTMQVLQDYAHQLDSQQMVLQCITVSLQNCYGLALLHYFIYQSYLQRKRHDAQVLLQTVQTLQHEAQIHAQSLIVSYPEFVAQTATPGQHVKQQKHQVEPARSHSNNPGETISSRISTTREEEMKTVDSVGEHGRDNRNVDTEQQPNGRRRVMSAATAAVPQAKQQPTQPKNDLEAFLGSSSDEEGNGKSGKQQGKRIANRRTRSADTSDDDDFFLDKEPEEEEEEEINAEITPKRGSKETELPTQQQQERERRTTAGTRTERPQQPPRPVQQEQDGAEKEQPKKAVSVDNMGSTPAPPLRSQAERNNTQRSTGNVAGIGPSTVESTASCATGSSVAGDTARDRDDEGKADALKRNLPANQIETASIQHQEDNGIKNAHPVAAKPASPQQRQEPTESIAAPPPSSMSQASQSVTPKEEMTRRQSSPNVNETTKSFSEDDTNLHTSKSTPAGKCDDVALNKNGKGNLESSEGETIHDGVGVSLVACSSVTAATQTGAPIDTAEDNSHNTPVPVHLGTTQQDDSDDEDDDGQFFIGDSTRKNDDDDDDDEFFIGSGSTYSRAAQTPPVIAHQKPSPPDSSTTPPAAGGKGNSTTTGTGGLSPEAREAIAKAQQAFESELYSSVVLESPHDSSNQPGPAAGAAASLGASSRAAGTILDEQDSAATAASTSTDERSKKHKKEKKKKKEDKKEKKKSEKKERRKAKHSGDV